MRKIHGLLLLSIITFLSSSCLMAKDFDRSMEITKIDSKTKRIYQHFFSIGRVIEAESLIPYVFHVAHINGLENGARNGVDLTVRLGPRTKKPIGLKFAKWIGANFYIDLLNHLNTNEFLQKELGGMKFDNSNVVVWFAFGDLKSENPTDQDVKTMSINEDEFWLSYWKGEEYPEGSFKELISDLILQKAILQPDHLKWLYPENGIIE